MLSCGARDLIKQARHEALRQHQLGENGQVHLIAEASRCSGLVTEQEGVQKALDLPGIALRAAGEDRADLIAQSQGVLNLRGGLIAEGDLDRLGV